MRLCFLSILGEPGTYDPTVYAGIPGGDDECRWFARTFAHLDSVEIVGARVSHGEAIPPPGSADAFVLGGSYNSVHDGHAWQHRLLDWFDELADAGRPLLAICGGHQLLGRYFGAEVDRVPAAPVAGTLPVTLTRAGRASPLFAGLDDRAAFHFANSEHLAAAPVGATVLAVHEDLPVAGLDYGGGWFSVQFHPEAEAETLATTWRGARRHLADRYATNAAGKRLLANFVDLARP